MGARAPMSTLKFPLENGAKCSLRSFRSSFSGKLSPVTPISEVDDSIEPQTPSVEPRELGGREGPEPTRFGDWELRGRCIDF
jgi:hypothetical protein